MDRPTRSASRAVARSSPLLLLFSLFLTCQRAAGVPCDQPGQTCILDHNVDYFGGDVGSVPAGKPEDCCGFCQERSDCASWTFSAYVCYLKTGNIPATENPGLVSGRKCEPLPPTSPPPSPSPLPTPRPSPGGPPTAAPTSSPPPTPPLPTVAPPSASVTALPTRAPSGRSSRAPTRKPSPRAAAQTQKFKLTATSMVLWIPIAAIILIVALVLWCRARKQATDFHLLGDLYSDLQDQRAANTHAQGSGGRGVTIQSGGFGGDVVSGNNAPIQVREGESDHQDGRPSNNNDNADDRHGHVADNDTVATGAQTHAAGVTTADGPTLSGTAAVSAHDPLWGDVDTAATPDPPPAGAKGGGYDFLWGPSAGGEQGHPLAQ